jgi:hypothetical protein
MNSFFSLWGLGFRRSGIACGVLGIGLVLVGSSDSQDSGGLSIARKEAGISIVYSGVLQSAESVLGPWGNVVGSSSPYETLLVGPQLFYRSIESGGIFATDSVVELMLRGPFQQHFDLASAGIPDGIFPPVRDKPYFDGTLEIGDMAWPVRLRVRGNSSLQECPFPKMKLKISRKNREGTMFEDARELKIGTHCAEGGRGNIGRLREELATYREVLVYEVMEGLGFVGPRVRRAKIHYQDTSSGEDESRFGWQLSRMAFLFDHVELVAEGIGGRALEDEEVAALVDANFDEQLMVDLMLFHALIGNWDYVLSSDGRGLWNTEVVQLEDGTLLPVAGDFDLSSWVTGRVRVTAPRDYFPDEVDLVRQVRFEVGRIHELFGATLFNKGMDRFVRFREAMEEQICSADLDVEGRDQVLEHVGIFFDELMGLAGENR